MAALAAAGKRPPGLAVVIVGEDPASQIYVRNKHLATEGAGMHSRSCGAAGHGHASRKCSTSCRQLNADPAIDGILVQLPVPKHIDSKAVIDAIAVEKDVDGFNPENLGLLAQRTPRLRPCTPYGCMKMLEHEGIDPKGMDAVVLGQSNIVGRPAALELLMRGATVTDLPQPARRICIGPCAARRPHRGRHRQAGVREGRLDQARRRGAGRGHQPPAFRQGGRRCGIRGRATKRAS